MSIAQAAAAADNGSMSPGGSPEDQASFMEQRANKMLDWANANESQRAAIKSIVERMRSELQPIRQEKTHLHAQLREALTAQTIDPAALEKLRADAASLFERGSKVVTKAVIDAGNVLSQEQRQMLFQRLEEQKQQKHRGHHH